MPIWCRPRRGSTAPGRGLGTRARHELGRSLVRAAMQQLQLSARAFHRILKLARTIADLEGTPDIATQHLAEAIQYRLRKEI